MSRAYVTLLSFFQEGQRMVSNMSEMTRHLEPVIAPLSEEEEQRAIKAVVDYLTEELGSEAKPHFRVLGAELRIDKPPRPEVVPLRLIRVLVADYDRKRNLDFVVDATGKIVRVEEYPGQPAFSLDEMKEAREIAERDKQVARFAKMRGSFVSEFGPALVSEQGDRLIGLRYAVTKKNQPTRLLVSVVVDLNERELVSIEFAPVGGDNHGSIR